MSQRDNKNRRNRELHARLEDILRNPPPSTGIHRHPTQPHPWPQPQRPRSYAEIGRTPCVRATVRPMNPTLAAQAFRHPRPSTPLPPERPQRPQSRQPPAANPPPAASRQPNRQPAMPCRPLQNTICPSCGGPGSRPSTREKSTATTGLAVETSEEGATLKWVPFLTHVLMPISSAPATTAPRTVIDIADIADIDMPVPMKTTTTLWEPRSARARARPETGPGAPLDDKLG